MITIGIDPRKSSVTAVAVDAVGRQQQVLRLAVTKTTTPAAPVMGRTLAGVGSGRSKAQPAWGAASPQQLAAAGEPVVDVPARLAARGSAAGFGERPQDRRLDAASVAAVARHHRRLNRVQAEDHATILRLLTERRDDVVAEQTRTMNRLHVHLRDLHPGGADRGLSTDTAAAVLRTVRPITPADVQPKAIARDLLADLRRLDTAVKDLDRQPRPRTKPAAASNDASPASSTGACSPTRKDSNEPPLVTQRGC